VIGNHAFSVSVTVSFVVLDAASQSLPHEAGSPEEGHEWSPR